jgi:hypothetical protein
MNEKEKELLAQWIAERDQLNTLIDGLKRRLGKSAGALPDKGDTSGREDHVDHHDGRPDEYFKMSQTEAAATYLKKVGHAAHIDKILEAPKAGGLKLSGKTPKATLYTSLVRGTKRFVLVSPGTFGLVEFYPDRKGAKEDK